MFFVCKEMSIQFLANLFIIIALIITFGFFFMGGPPSFQCEGFHQNYGDLLVGLIWVFTGLPLAILGCLFGIIVICRNRSAKKDAEYYSLRFFLMVSVFIMGSPVFWELLRNFICLDERYLFLVCMPLVLLLIALVIQLIQIHNAVIFPAAIYFVIVASLLGPEPWWHYPLGLVGLLLFSLLIAKVMDEILNCGSVVGDVDVIKLFALIGGALV